MSKVPKLRFKEFEEEWNSAYIGELYKMSSGGTPNRKNQKYWNGFIPWITTTEISNHEIIESANEFITQEGLENSSAKLFPENTILIAMYGQGKTRGKSSILNIDATTNQACLGLFPNENFSTYFVFQYLKRNYEKLRISANSGSQKNLSMALIKDFPIKYPGLAEQKRISNLLRKLDNKIKKQQEKVELLKEQKKGYMQKIFNRELRFKDENGKEFPKWESVKLKDLVRKKSKGKKSTIVGKGNVLLENDYMENGAKPRYVKESNNVIEHDLLILWDGSQAGKVYTGYEGVLGSTFVSLKFENETVSSYIYYLLKQEVETIQRKWREGSGVPHVSKDFVEMFLLELPSPGEQGKIVSFFKELERKIKLEEDLLLNLKKEKKAYMQQMFV